MKKITSLFICIAVIASSVSTAFALGAEKINDMLSSTGKYILETVQNPTVASIGGEWAVMGLARSGLDVPEGYFDKYYKAAEEYVKSCGGVLHDRKYTEYSRVIVALTAIGKNPENVGGYNLLLPLGDFDKTVWQGINGAVWALIALDSGNWQIPQNNEAAVQATSQMYVDYILNNQTADGGWSISGDGADIDVTAMALCALSRYSESKDVQNAIDRAVSFLSENQNENGGFSSFGTENSESTAQVTVALCTLGIALDDERFVKKGNTLIDALSSYYIQGKGFKHTLDDNYSNQMATEQCFYALAAAARALDGKNSLYDMSDVEKSSENNLSGLTDKNPDVHVMDVVNPDKTFFDITDNKNRAEIEALASRNIINGKTENTFDPGGNISRAEFAAIIVRGLGLPEKSGANFEDVAESDWYYSYVNTAYSYGIINGVSQNEFNPSGSITREEAAVMTARAAKLCGLNTDMELSQARDILAEFTDYVKASDWAFEALAFCCKSGIIGSDEMELMPKENAPRGEIAAMLYNMLERADLI